MTTVIDASYAVDLILNADRRAANLANRNSALGGLIAPVIFWHEVASALRNQSVRGVIGVEFRDAGLRRMRRLVVRLDAEPSGIERVLAVSDRYQLTVYNAAYLELALRTASAIATRDGGLAAAARKAGVALAASA